MRTTIDIPDELFRVAKQATLERGCTLRDLMTHALENDLRGGAAGKSRSRIPLPKIRVEAHAPILRMTPSELAKVDLEADVEKLR